MKNINAQSTNQVVISGVLLEKVTVDGFTKVDKRPYKRGNFVVRVAENFAGRPETSEIIVSMFATKFKKDGGINPAYENILRMENEMKSAADVGIDAADGIRVTAAQLQENAFVSRSGQLIEGWQVRGAFWQKHAASADNMAATFIVDAYIMNIEEEMSREGDPTGRLLIQGGLVQYGGKLDVLTFIVEDPDKVDFVSRNWEPNTTVQIKGHIRLSTEEKTSVAENEDSWGEQIVNTTTSTVRELIVTGGSNEAFDEDMAYDPEEIRKAYLQRKAAREQLLIDSKNNTPAPAPATTAPASYSWED